MGGITMVSVMVIVALLLGAGWMVWKRRSRWHTPNEASASEATRPEALAFEAFSHGNTCLAMGKFDEAKAAFEQARELDPKRPHVAERLAEVARQQQGASQSTPPSLAS
jgi:cytochrome c-type biogenesis protein CcmH/NrfG